MYLDHSHDSLSELKWDDVYDGTNAPIDVYDQHNAITQPEHKYNTPKTAVMHKMLDINAHVSIA